MADAATTRMVIPSELAEVPQVQQTILAAVEQHGYAKDALFAIRLALEEALSNAIRHGNCDDASKTVTVEYSVTDEAVRITVTDEGYGFEPGEVPDPCAEENLERPHGRGVMLIQAYMSEVSYNERGNRVTMIRRRDHNTPPGGEADGD